MSRLWMVLLCISMHTSAYAQRDVTSSYTQQQLEDVSEKNGEEVKDDRFLQRLYMLSRHPLNLNKAGKEELRESGLLNELQINQFLSYRRLLGKLLSLYELQAVPGWDVPLIESVLPYVTLADAATGWDSVKKGWKGGEHSFLLRYASLLEKAEGYRTDSIGSTPYAGSPARLYVRYLYKNKHVLQMGILGEKDAGEQFFRKSQKAGFDFYSFHAATGKLGIIRQLVVGDYTVSMGQGLIQWQGLSLGMGTGLVAAQRQSPVLHPYSSPGELSFHRGAGISLQKKEWELTGFFLSGASAPTQKRIRAPGRKLSLPCCHRATTAQPVSC